MGATQLQAVLDQADVTARLARVARLLDSKQWSRAGEFFAEDVQFDYGDGRGFSEG